MRNLRPPVAKPSVEPGRANADVKGRIAVLSPSMTGSKGFGFAMGCPQCGQHDTVLQSVVSSSLECRPELGGCGANFDQPTLASPEKVADIRSALDTMLEAISHFESRDLSRNLSKDDPERIATNELMTRLRQQIATLSSALSS